VREAVQRGNTLRARSCVHWVRGEPGDWLAAQRGRIVGVELTDESIRLADLGAATVRTVVLLGHERTGIPPEGLAAVDVAVEIPMLGHGSSLNVAVAGSLVLYRLAGLL
jgi:tRNA G18 (ribose-2'-O)-methylase SpoU